MATTSPAGIYYRTNGEAVSTLEAQALSLANSVNNAVGYVPVVPSSVAVGSGSASVTSNSIISFSGATSLSMNNIFSSAFRSYRLVISIDSSSGNTELMARLRTTTDNTANYFQGGTRTNFVGTTSTYSLSNGSGIYFGHIATDTNRTAFYVIDISYPNVALCTSWTSSGYGNIGGTGPSNYQTGGTILDVVQYTGLSIFGATGTANLVGTVQVYGYR